MSEWAPVSRRQAIAGIGGIAAAGFGINARRVGAGSALWRVQAPAGINALVPAGRVVCMSIGESIESLGSAVGTDALDAATGRRAWESYGSGNLLPMAAGPGTVFCSDKGATITAVRADTGQVNWRRNLNTVVNFLPGSSMVYDRGTLYTSITEWPFTKGSVLALDSATGRSRWTAPAPALPSALAVAHGVVYTGWPMDGNGPSFLAALDAGTGARRWTARLPFSPGLLAVSDNTVVAGPGMAGVGDGITSAVAVDARNGRVLWRLTGLPALGIAASDGIACTLAVTVQAVELRTGRQLWAQDSLDNPGAIALANGVLYAQSWPWLYAVSAATGKVLWRFRQGAGQVATFAMAVGSHAVYAAVDSNPGHSPSAVYAIRT